MYPNDAVASFITNHFVPAKFHVKEQPKAFERFNAMWTPTILVLDDQGQERHRIEGFLPPDDFRAQLALGLGKAAFAAGRCVELRYPGAVRPWQHVLEPLSGYLRLAERLLGEGGAALPAYGLF